MEFPPRKYCPKLRLKIPKATDRKDVMDHDNGREIIEHIFRIDEDSLTLFYVDETIPLTPTQLPLLVYLFEDFLKWYPQESPGVHQKILIEKCLPDTANYELRHKFRDSPLWGYIIIPVPGRKGNFRLHLGI